MDIDLDLYRHEVRVSASPLADTAALRRASFMRLVALRFTALRDTYPYVDTAGIPQS
jgi:hypothetical protein